MSVFDLLREAMQQRFAGSVTRLAEACGVPVQSASKWVAEDPRKRTIPGPASCQKIAEGLGQDPDYVLALAGHRRPEERDVQRPDPIEVAIRARSAEMREAVRDIPPVYWSTVIRKIFDRAIGEARDAAELLRQAVAETTTATEGPTKRRGRVRSPAVTPAQRPIKPR